MKRIYLLFLLNTFPLFAGKPDLAFAENNKEAVLDFITALTCPDKQEESWKMRCLEGIADFDCNALFFYKRIQYNASPLFAAVVVEDWQTVEEILERGASVDFPNPDGVTPLMQAAYNQNVPIFTKLKQAGANLQAVDKEEYSVLNHAQRNRLNPDNPILQFFEEEILERGSDETTSDAEPHYPGLYMNPSYEVIHTEQPLNDDDDSTRAMTRYFENPRHTEERE